MTKSPGPAQQPSSSTEELHDRRSNPELRRLIEEMLERVREMNRNVQVWSPEERARAEADAARPGATVTSKLMAGPAAEVIAERAEEGQFDLLVVGSRGRNMIASALLGGTSHRIIHLSKKPVLVVH
jgi:nucleotide-binding universal stress UspA family protein